MAIEAAKDKFDIPFIGVVNPGAEVAINTTENETIGVIGTTGTINSQAYQSRMRELNPSVEIIGKACPLFVQIVEEGWENSDVAYYYTKILIRIKGT